MRPIYIQGTISLNSSRNGKYFKVEEKIETCVLCSINFVFGKLCRLWDNVEKYCRAGQATDENVAHAQCVMEN
jgi:hypothetical protein